MKLELEGASAAITSVDAQASHCQGVVVFVTGQLQRRVCTLACCQMSCFLHNARCALLWLSPPFCA